MAARLVEGPAEPDGGQEDGERIGERQGSRVALAQQRQGAFEVTARGEVEAEGVEGPGLGHRSVDGARNRERGLGQRHRLAESTANHQRVGQIRQDAGALAGRRIHRHELRGSLQRGHAGLPVSGLVGVPGEAVVEAAGSHRLRNGIGLGDRRSHEIDRTTCVARLDRCLGRLLDDLAPIDPGRERARIDLRPQLEGTLEIGPRLGERQPGGRSTARLDGRGKRPLEVVGHQPVMREHGGRARRLVHPDLRMRLDRPRERRVKLRSLRRQQPVVGDLVDERVTERVAGRLTGRRRDEQVVLDRLAQGIHQVRLGEIDHRGEEPMVDLHATDRRDPEDVLRRSHRGSGAGPRACRAGCGSGRGPPARSPSALRRRTGCRPTARGPSRRARPQPPRR